MENEEVAEEVDSADADSINDYEVQSIEDNTIDENDRVDWWAGTTKMKKWSFS